MTLQEALKTLIDAKGLEILKTPLSLNILSDFNAFEEIPSSKNVLKNFISEGYLEKIAFLYNNGFPLGDAPSTYANELYHKLGLRADVSNYVINSVLGSLGYDEILSIPISEEKGTEVYVQKEVIPTISPNSGSHLEFKGISINGSLDGVAQALEQMGYTEVDGGPDGILLNGKFAGFDDCQILISASPHTHQTYSVSVFTPAALNWWSVKGNYERVKTMLQKKYGRPLNKTEFFADPYEEGDGYELTAFQTGNAVFVSEFKNKDGIVRVHITDQAQLLISYVDKINGEEHEKADGIAAENDI